MTTPSGTQGPKILDDTERLDREVQASLSRFRAPIDRELEAMRGKMDQLGQKLDALRGKRQ